MSEHAESPNCACTCHRDTDTCALTGPHRHPRTGCCVCCPTIAVPWQALADTYVTLGRVGYVLRIAEPLLVVGDVLDLYDRSGSAPYEVASIERVMTLPPRQVVNGCQSVLLKPIPATPIDVEPHTHSGGDEASRREREGNWPEREQPTVHRAILDDVDGWIVTRTCSCGESFTTTSANLPVVWADHINRTTHVPDLRTRVAQAIRDAYRRRSDGEGDHEEWWYEAADAVTALITEET